MDDYTRGDDVTYVISAVNSGATPLAGLTVTDDLGAYTVGENTVYPLTYTDGTTKLMIGIKDGAVSAIHYVEE